MKIKRIITAILAVSTLLLSINSYAATVLVNEGKVNTRTEALATSQSRLFDGTGTYNGYLPAWPGSNGSHYSGVIAPWAYSGALSHEEVFGSKCDDLMYFDYNSIYSVEDMLYEEQKDLSTASVAEWNGFLFAICYGSGNAEYEKTEYYQYGNGKTITYSGISRTDNTTCDSFLYIFDISRAENYGSALYGRWSMEELGFDKLSKAPLQRMDRINVDDDYIYITLTNSNISAAVGTVADSNDKLLAVFKNNVDRENPDYEEGTNIVKAPPRAESAEAISSFPYGAKQIYDQSAISESTGLTYTTTVIGGKHLMWFDKAMSLAASTSKLDTFIYVTDIEGANENVSVGDTKIYYGLSKNATSLSNSTGIPVSTLLSYKVNGAWTDVLTPYINSIVYDGDIIYFLVTYGVNDNGVMRYYRRIYVTDWSNPMRPKAISMHEWEAEEYTETVALGTVVDNSLDRMYCYDGYAYVSGVYGFDIVKLKDEDGNYNMSKISYIPYSVETTGLTTQCRIVAVGNYLILWNEAEGMYPATKNWGAESKIRLTPDKTASAEVAYYGPYFRRHDNIAGNSTVTYGNRIYVPTVNHSTAFALTGCVEVINFSGAAPIELSVEPVSDVVTVPYTIKGKAFGLNAVKITVNGEESYVPTTAGEGNYKEWKYEITEAGEYSIDVVGAVLMGFPNEKTAEHLSFKATVAGDTDYNADYEEIVNDDYSVNFTVTPYIRNNNFTGSIKAVPAVAIYSGSTMVKMIKGDEVTIPAGESITFAPIEGYISPDIVEYSVKLFLLGGVESITPLTPSVTLR